MWCCSLMAKQSSQGSVLQLGCVAELPGAQPLLCLPALTSWEDHPTRRSWVIFYLEAEHEQLEELLIT